MTFQRRSFLRQVFGCATAGLLFSTSTSFAQWSQWGGPGRDFSAPTSGLAEAWPEQGPRQLWERSLGTGYSGIALSDGVLFSMYRTSADDEFEVTVALDAASGKTLWEHRASAPVPDSAPDYGKRYSGPNSTPLVVGARVFSVGRNAQLRCFQAADGKLLWEVPLLEDFGAETHACGFSTSPIAFGNTIILPIGQVDHDFFEGRSLVAFDQRSGEVVWADQTFKSWHSSPILIERAGQAELVLCSINSLLGVNPGDGSLLWKYVYPARGDYEGIWSSPVWDGKDTLYFSSRQLACAVRLEMEGSKTSARELWVNPISPMGMGTPLLVNTLLIGAKRGESGLFMALDAASGKRLWSERMFKGATLVGDAQRLILLDDSGQLALLEPSAEGLKILSQCQLTEEYSFTAPALVGNTLYVRDERRIMALDLSAEGNQPLK